MGDWKPLPLPPEVEARVSTCIDCADAANEIIKYLKGSGLATHGCNCKDNEGEYQPTCRRAKSVYYQCACGSDDPFKFRVTTNQEGKAEVSYRGRHYSEVPGLSSEAGEGSKDDPEDFAAAVSAAAAAAAITTGARDDGPDPSKRQRHAEEEQEVKVESQASGTVQGRTAGQDDGESPAPGADWSHTVEPTRIPYRPENEGIVRGKLHHLVAEKNCKYYKAPFKKKELVRDVWHGQDDDDSDECCMTFREIRDGIAGAFRKAQKLDNTLSRIKSDCMLIGGDRVEYFLDDENCLSFNTVLVYHGGDFLAKIKKPLWWIRNQILLKVDQFVLEWDDNAKALMERRGEGSYVGKVYSLIVSYGHVPAQEYHIDQAYPHYFASLSLTTEGKGTTVVPVQNKLGIPPGQLTPERALEQMFKMVTPRSDKDLPRRFLAAIKEYDDKTATYESLGDLEIPLQKVLSEYGWLMTSNETRNECLIPSVESNDLGYTGMPGSVIHCGPEFDRFRGTVFSAYCLVSDKPYNYNFQLNAGKFVLSFFKMREFLENDKQAQQFLRDLYKVVVAQEPAVIPSCKEMLQAMGAEDKALKKLPNFICANDFNDFMERN